MVITVDGFRVVMTARNYEWRRGLAEAAPNHQESDDRARAQALARVAAAIAANVGPATLQSLVCDGLSAGASEVDIVATLFEAAPLIGSVRLVTTVPDLAAAIGYDLDEVFEHLQAITSERESAIAVASAAEQATSLRQEKS